MITKQDLSFELPTCVIPFCCRRSDVSFYKKKTKRKKKVSTTCFLQFVYLEYEMLRPKHPTQTLFGIVTQSSSATRDDPKEPGPAIPCSHFILPHPVSPPPIHPETTPCPIASLAGDLVIATMNSCVRITRL